MTTLDTTFVATVLAHYKAHGRHTLPWRLTHDPYHILISEIMLQQTQVERVVPKYEAFLKRFPTVAVLAGASLLDVLRLWQGLGYNRRAKSLWLAAQAIMQVHEGEFPTTYTELLALPGVGHYTAGAVLAFAFNTGIPIIETNIRTVVIQHYFKEHSGVTESAILEVVQRTLPKNNPREWYYALMDYGSYLKATQVTLNSKSAIYKKQSKFAGSTRQVRAGIVRALLGQPEGATVGELQKQLVNSDKEVMEAQLVALVKEGMVVKAKKRYQIPT